ncbi:MAG TPA: ABC transporter permease [bacterium]|nr:ABC transporter permease [bacterium]
MPELAPDLRALWAATVKSLRIYSRYRLNAVMQMFNALIWLPPFYFLGKAFADGGKLPGLAAYTGTHDYATFLVVGWVLAGFVYGAFWGIGFSLWLEMAEGTLEPVWLTPTPPWVVLLGESMRTFVTTALASAVLVVVAWGALGVRFSVDAVRAALVLLPALIALYGLGFAVAGLVLLAKDPGNLIDMVSYSTCLLSGDRFPVAALPKPLFVLALAIPLTYAFDGIRHVLLGTTSIVPFWAEVGILVAFMVVMIALGYASFRLADRRVRRLGTLSQH